ncbi:hypothetical protein JHS3_23540 [Jeongeupia sp. HS-3]|uniref:YidB family protein n=1 Tax=Jeongeupia sp. HS-3 TaxID=1009682 RepID=UPI0018A5EA6F|nr:YidB family protein [Jeongeupia sp. HS-3]BCL76618.1 hypothetical protein JHS3_23540 [Jeongeupia sp. HS-3]
MGLLDQLTGALGGGNQEGAGGLLGALGPLLEQQGGISGLVEKFQQGGLAEVAQSWISTGQNLPISADQIQAVLGSDAVSQIASKLGIDPSAAAGQLSEALPQLVDKLTPNGEVQQGGDLLAQGLDLLKGKLFG